ncbi:MAG: UbiA family prenyltransferase [Candidatus Aminicenantes bacterium]|nr:UbiA family prenyltransferase [Candidatus Aminicenantes bacterium]
MLQEIYSYLKLMRIGNCLIAFFSIFVTSFFVSQSFILRIPVFLGALAALFIMGGGNSLNDYFDYRIDKLNKPNRPIPSGLITRRRALLFSICLFCTGIFLGLFLNIFALSIVFINTSLLIFYARYSKTMSFGANALIALMTSSVFIYAAAILNIINTNIIVLASSAFFVMTAREILKDIEDIHGDTQSGASTLPVKLGIRRARTISSLFILPAVFLIFVPQVLGTMTELYLGLILCATAVLVVSFFLQAKQAQKIIKVAAIIVLTAFLVGSL